MIMSDISVSDIRRLDMGLLLVFDAVMAARNFTKAAEQLAMTQSAVSQAVGRLRDIFDDPLFIRQQAGVLPSERALEIGARSYSSVASILNNNLDRRTPRQATDGPAIDRPNIRGPQYFH